METNYHTIQQISDMTGLTVHTLRYYEKIGLLNGIRRDAGGYRQYTESDLAWIDFIIRLRETGMKISDMKRFADLRSQGDPTISSRRELLEAHQSNVLAQIHGLQSNLKKIEEKIEYYKRMEGRNEL